MLDWMRLGFLERLEVLRTGLLPEKKRLRLLDWASAVDMQMVVSETMTESAWQELRKLRAAEAEIALFIRENYRDEIKSGAHAGFRDAYQAAIWYMSRERKMTKAQKAARTEGEEDR